MKRVERFEASDGTLFEKHKLAAEHEFSQAINKILYDELATLKGELRAEVAKTLGKHWQPLGRLAKGLEEPDEG